MIPAVLFSSTSQGRFYRINQHNRRRGVLFFKHNTSTYNIQWRLRSAYYYNIKIQTEIFFVAWLICGLTEWINVQSER